MTIQKLIEDFKNKKITNSKISPNAIEDYIKETLEIKTYLPFQVKREIVKQVVNANIEVVNGYKTISSINQFLSFVITMLVSYTNLEIDEPYEAYDLLMEENLLQPIIECFRAEYDACDVLLKMEIDDQMQTNTTPAIVAQFLDKIGENLGGLSEVLSEKVKELDIGSILASANINDENLAAIRRIFNK